MGKPFTCRVCDWHGPGRWIVFALAASSIACLLAELYEVCPMQVFTPFIFLPAVAALFIIAAIDRSTGNGDLWRAVWMGTTGGLLAAVAYDLFRLPFVFAKEWDIDSTFPAMNLFKVFPRFGAMILGEPIEQAHYSLAAHTLGWIYHFSNGATFGVMYLALLRDPARSPWGGAVLFALVLELGMLLTPYPATFNIPLTGRFVAITVGAHAIFGIGLGLCVRWLARRPEFRLRAKPWPEA